MLDNYKILTNIDAGNFTSNPSKADGNSYSCAVEDLLIEMTRKELQGCNDNDNTNCYRCKHLLNIPRTFEKISDDTEECIADLNFVQSIVWLRSAILFMKTIPVEQFHLVFYKQWKNTGNNTKSWHLTLSFIKYIQYITKRYKL